MKDTSAEVDARFNALFAQRSASDRVRMACEMFDLARALMVADLESRHPAIAPSELRARIFERMYGGDFGANDRARILARIRR